MRDVPMPRDLSEEAVAEWLQSLAMQLGKRTWKRQARAVRALLREKVREAAAHPRERVVTQSCECCSDVVEITPDEIVSRVLGEEAPRG